MLWKELNEQYQMTSTIIANELATMFYYRCVHVIIIQMARFFI